MKKVYISVLLTSLLVVAAAFTMNRVIIKKEEKHLNIGFVYVGDASTVYTGNFIKAMKAIEKEYGARVDLFPIYNVPEGDETDAFKQLVKNQCDIIFSTSYGYSQTAKKFAQYYPAIQVCQATGSNANEEPMLQNYHTFMGEIYQGRYISGAAAGMKLAELIRDGKITAEQAKVGYVAAFPCAEVISGYTAFFLGVRSVVPQAVMDVIYTDSWSSYELEKSAAERLISDGCVIISQHSDTTGPAVACETTDRSVVIYHVGYNQSMISVAPTTSLTGCRINWEPYVMSAVDAVMNDKSIENNITAKVNGRDTWAGFSEGWVEMLPLNTIVAADGTENKIEELISAFKKNSINVFSGDYTGTDPSDSSDTCDLNGGFRENADSSAPVFHYVLDDVITIIE